MSKRETSERLRKGDRGIALIIVLSFLGLGVALALSFAYSARLENMAADNALQLDRTRLMADAAMRQAVGVLANAYDGRHGAADMYPATVTGAEAFYTPTAGPFAGRSYLVSSGSDNDGIAEAMATRFNGKDFIPDAVMDVSSPSSPTADDRGWNHVVVNGKVVGRTAWMIIDESGKIDPSAVVNGSGSEATGQTKDGDSVNEIALQDAGVANYDGYRTQMPAGARWFSLKHIANELSPSDFSSAVTARLYPHSYSPETYWNDNDNDGAYDSGEEYDRLDITSAADMTLAKLYKAFVAADDPDTALPNIGDRNDANDCTWIKKLAADGVAATGADRRRIAAQVAANLVDYQDGDSTSTVAWVKASTGQLTQTDPGADAECKVIGYEGDKWGLSELAVGLRCKTLPPVEEDSADAISPTDHDHGNGALRLRVRPRFKAEIFNPAATDLAFPAGGSLTVTFKCVVRTARPPYTYTFFDNVSTTVSMNSTANEAGGTLWYSNGWQWGASARTIACVGGQGGEEADAAAEAIRPLDDDDEENYPDYYFIDDFRIVSVVLNDGTEDVDVFPASALHAYWFNWSSAQVDPDAGDTDLFYATVKAYDPQNNDRDEGDSDLASFLQPDPDGASYLYRNTDNSGNIGALTTPAGGGSTNDYRDVVVLNTPFTRVGEIGRVASYLPMRSLRLWSSGATDVTGHDAHLLDLFKTGSATEKRGKININTPTAGVLDALFQDATTVTAANARAAVLAARAAGTTFDNIGDLFGDVPGVTGSDPTNDTAEEAAVSRLAELITVRQNYFSVLVCAQAIQDLPTGVSGGTRGTYDAGVDKILGNSRLLATVYRDALTGRIAVERVTFLDD